MFQPLSQSFCCQCGEQLLLHETYSLLPGELPVCSFCSIIPKKNASQSYDESNVLSHLGTANKSMHQTYQPKSNLYNPIQPNPASSYWADKEYHDVNFVDVTTANIFVGERWEWYQDYANRQKRTHAKPLNEKHSSFFNPKNQRINNHIPWKYTYPPANRLESKARNYFEFLWLNRMDKFIPIILSINKDWKLFWDKVRDRPIPWTYQGSATSTEELNSRIVMENRWQIGMDALIPKMLLQHKKWSTFWDSYGGKYSSAMDLSPMF